MNNKTIRCQQRFHNLQKAYAQFSKNVNIKTPNDTEKQGIIKSVEYTFELSWKTLKDYLESLGLITNSPREVLKQAFHAAILLDGDVWIDMLDQRNLMAHTYNEEQVELALELIYNNYYPAIKTLVSRLESELTNLNI